jgi:hypothetical protein
MAEPAEPMTIIAAVTPDFRRALEKIRVTLGLEGEIVTRNGDKFRLDVDARGIGIATLAAANAAVTVPWSSMGRIREEPLVRDAWRPGMLVELLTALFAYGPYGSTRDRMGYPVLCIPVTVGDAHIELAISVDSPWGVARQVERCRPRPAYGTAKPWP